MGGGVAEPDPKALKMMIQMVAKFRGPFRVRSRARLCICHVHCASDEGRIIKVSCFLVFLWCALLSGSVTMRQWSK